jgi:CheY-like chemotaxis protein
MVVDDDSDDIELFVEAVHEIDARLVCQSSSSGMEALTLLESTTIKPEIIFVDMNMPILNGKEFVKLIRQNKIYNDTKLFLYSTVDLSRNLPEMKLIGADGFLRKPISYSALKNDLSEVIHNCLKSHTA